MNTLVRFEDPNDEVIYLTMRSLGLSVVQAVEAVFAREQHVDQKPTQGGF